MRPRSTTVDRVIARLAGRAQGVVTRQELLAGGVTAGQVRRRVRSGALIPEYPGVYRVGHAAPSVEARYMAAVKACGEGAVLSGLAAAHLLGLIKRAPAQPEVTAPKKRAVEGIVTHRARRIERMRIKGIPVTTPARTLVDVAPALSEQELARACHEAQVRFRTTPAQVEAVLEHKPNAPGAGRLRRILHGDTALTLSALERGFLALVREAGLPLPQTNRRVGAHYVDCRWPECRLTVELDGYRYHHSRHAWEQDRRRERAAYARGDDFRRYTWGDVFEHPHLTRAELERLFRR